MIQRAIVVLLGLLLLGAGAIVELRHRWTAPLHIAKEGYLLTVADGDSLRTVAGTLYKDGVLTYPRIVTLYGRWTGLDQQIKRGEYLLPKKLTVKSLLAMLQNGDVIKYQVTFPEGITLEAAIGILAKQEQLDTVLTGKNDPRLLELIQPQSLPEGLFFPDSYQYSRGDTDLSILQRAHEAMVSVLSDEWHRRELNLPYETPYQALIMASIIERETGLSTERGQIAGVFARRLQRGMLLQTDPTVIYGLGNEFDGNLQRKHLTEEGNPYNTYRHPGLPPTPIALPGRAAIHAALHPDSGSTLYFVARGDGGHVFSETLTEHNRAVRAYQLHRDADYRSAPRDSD